MPVAQNINFPLSHLSIFHFLDSCASQSDDKGGHQSGEQFSTGPFSLTAIAIHVPRAEVSITLFF